MIEAMDHDAGASTSRDIGVVRARNNIDPAAKKQALSFLMALVDGIARAAKYECTASTTQVIPLTLSGTISGILSSVFTHLRKTANKKTVYNATPILEREISFSPDAKMSMRALLGTPLMMAAIAMPVDFAVATPICNMLTIFKLRYAEVRLGVTKFTKKKIAGKSDVVGDISEYGLSVMHLPLCAGITYPPERRSGLLKTLGPMTLSILLVEERMYKEKLASALFEVIKTAPKARAYVNALSSVQKKDVGGLMSAMGNVLLVATDRSHNKMAFPVLAFLKAYFIDKKGTEAADFSSKGGYFLYQTYISTFNYQVTSVSTDTGAIRQCIFHGMFGTHLENMSVLEQITVLKAWYHRSDLSEVFQQVGGEVREVAGLIKFVWVAKMKSACQTGLVANNDPQETNISVFSGNRKRTFSDRAIAHLQSQSMSRAFDESVYSITAALTEEAKNLMRTDAYTRGGTTQWTLAGNLAKQEGGEAYTFGPEPAEPFVVEERAGRYFYKATPAAV